VNLLFTEQLDKSIASQGMKQELHHQMSRVQGNSDLQSPFNNFFGQGHPPQAAPASQETKNKKPVSVVYQPATFFGHTR